MLSIPPPENNMHTENTINIVDQVIDVTIPNDLLHLINSLDENFASSTNKENKKETSKTKSCRSSHNHESSKKRSKKLQEGVKNMSYLKDVLTSNTTEVNKEKKESNTRDITKESSVIVISDENEEKCKSTDMIFSHDADLSIIIEAVNIKKKLINEKCDIDRKFACCLEEVTNLKNQIRLLSDELISAEKKLSETSNYREQLTEKLKWVIESLN